MGGYTRTRADPAYSPTAANSAATSPRRAGAYRPDCRSPSLIGPDRGTHQPGTGCPTSSSIRRTMCLRPSCRHDLHQRGLAQRVHPTRNESTFAGPSSSSTPASSRCPAPARHRPGHLGQVGLRDLVRRVHQLVREGAVVGEQQQALAVRVEPADVVDPLLDTLPRKSASSARPFSSAMVETTPRGLFIAR